MGSAIADDPAVACALSLEIPVETMRRANLMVDRDTDKHTPAEAATWLLSAAPQRDCEKLTP
jgi:osmoprotectant transport system permease protein